MKPLYGLEAITDLKWFGDDKIFEFMEWWKDIVTNNTIALSQRQLAEILVIKMAPSKELAQDVAYWKRLPVDNCSGRTNTS